MRIRWRGLELPNRVVSDPATLTDTYGKFTAEPFERGFGVTVGNSLRRILLSSLEGSAVTRVKIQGVQHEISTIPGVVEDVTDIILNIKSLVVKNTSDQPKTIRIDRHERGVVTAAIIIDRRGGADHQPRAHHRHADRRRAVRRRDDGRERPRLSHGRRERRQGARDRRHPGRFELLARSSASSTRSRTPASASGPTTTSWSWKSGPTAPSAADGPGRRGQDPAQAPESVHPVRRAGPGTADRRPDGRADAGRRRSITNWSAS